uniref:CYP450 n=1 Tax=Locusta migratoria TaxID=7004 RepID=A0A6F8H163_LOCMI|nr:CYP450 [Locusta migratoria]
MAVDCWTVVVSLVVGALLAAWQWWRHYSTRFARLGLPYEPPVPLLGNLMGAALGSRSQHDIVVDLYNKFKPHPYGGAYLFAASLVMIRDPEIIRTVTIKDFDYFTDHADFFDSERSCPIQNRMLFLLRGKEWHYMRTTLSPAFTSMKMKNMFMLITEIAQQMVDYLKKETAAYKVSTNKDDVLTLEVKDFFTRISNDMIATSAFGVKVDSLSDPENMFYRMGKDLTNISMTASLGYIVFPRLMRLLGIPLFSPKAIEYFKSMVSETIETREKQGIVRPDMLHLLMQARRGELTSEEGEEDGNTKGSGRHLTDLDMAAQAMIFFFAGFETVSSVLTFCSYLLAAHEDVQRRLQQEVDDVMKKSGGQPSYEQVIGCQYLDMVISETLRMYTPLSAMDRVCVRPYRLPATDTCPAVDLRPGDIIWLPVRAIHFDPKYYTEPKRFDPERFSPENKHLIKPYTYFPFGSGPRICIGQRFAMMEMKVLLLYFLSRFSFQMVSKTPVPLELSPGNVFVAIKGGSWLGIRPRS